ncbi:MAG: anti-sigma factor antagonist [Solobacterium sp.]|nr:anti-sigma factor antagonist [Solobacterium sp.]
MSEKVNNDEFLISLEGRIDSNNASQTEKDILARLEGQQTKKVTLDAEKLEYISSAGLRVILRIRKAYPGLKIINVSSEVYEILDMTGFTQMMPVEKAYRVVSVEGCEEIGRGANGTIYRIDQDNVVKVYNNADALADIQHEREVAKLALILGIPTAISYDVVKIGSSYGSVYEFLNARSFSKIIATEPDKFDWCVREYVNMLKKIHETVVPEGKLPDIKETVIKWAEFMKDYLPKEAGDKLYSLVEAVPHDDHMIHGDYHTKNLELQNDEVLLIDMDTLAVGHPIFELASIYNAFLGYSELDHEVIKDFQGFDYDTAKRFFRKTLEEYLGTTNDRKINEVMDKARIVGYARLIRRSIRRRGMESEKGRAEIELWTKNLLELLEKTDSLTYEANELEIEAKDENIPEMMAFIEEHLEVTDCPQRELSQISLAAEEVFTNIAHYAYAPETGNAVLRIEVTEDPVTVTLTFIDNGVQYDPLVRREPDVNLSAEEREVGGLGIFLVKKTMDDVNYEYKDGQNILSLKKKL